MNLIAISAVAAREYPGVVESIIEDLLNGEDERMVSVDIGTVRQRQALYPEHAPIPAHRIDLSEWLKQGTDAYLPDENAIWRSALERAADVPIVVNASGYQLATIVPVLRECRAAWFDLETWHPGFVVVCNDLVLPYVSEELFDTFYARPRQLTRIESVRLVNGILRRATLARWFGLASSRRLARLWGLMDWGVRRREAQDIKELRKWTAD